MNERAIRIYGLSVFVISAVVYILTCCRTVFIGDSGELSLALTTGGVAHPPGYPLYTILGYIWLKIFFFLRPAFAANLFSSAAAASSAAVLFLLLQRIKSKSLPIGVSAAISLMYAFAYPLWSSATNAEVYALSGLLYISALYSVIRYYQDGQLRSLIIAAFFCGLTLTHHYSAGVIIAGLAAAMIFSKHRITSGRVLIAAVAIVMPLTLYPYLLLRFDPALPVNWMAEKSMSGLWGLMTCENYRQFAGIPTAGDLSLCIQKISWSSFLYFGPGLIVVAIPGIMAFFRKSLRLALIVVIPAVLNLIMSACYHIPDYQGYLMPLLVAAVLLIYGSVEWIWRRFAPGKAMTCIIAAVLIIMPLFSNYSKCNISNSTLAERYARDILDSTADNSILFLKSDNGSYPSLYLRYAEGYREDVAVYTQVSTLVRLQHIYGNGDFNSILKTLESGTARIFWGTEYIVNQGMNPSPSEKSQRGILYGRLGDEDDQDLNSRIAAFTAYELPNFDLKDDLKAKQVYLEYKLHHIDRMMRAGLLTPQSPEPDNLRSWAKDLDDPMTALAVAQFFRSRGFINQSLKWVDLAISDNPSSYEEKDLYVNLGTIYRQAGDLGMAGQALSKALSIDPSYEPARHNAYLVQAETALQQQNWPEALKAFGVLLDMDPDNSLHYYNMAVIYERMPGRAADAVKYYKSFISKADENNLQAVERVRQRIVELESSLNK